MRDAGHRIGFLIALLDEHAARVRQAPLHAGDQIAAVAAAQSVVGTFVLQRVVHVERGAIGVQEVRTEPAARPEIAVGHFGIDAEALSHSIRPTCAVTIIIRTLLALRQRVLSENVRAPGSARVVADLQHAVGAFALLAIERNERAGVLTLVLARTGAHAPALSELVTQVQLLRIREEALVLLLLVGLRAHVEPLEHLHAERAADVFHVGQRALTRRGVPRAERLRVHRESARHPGPHVAETDAQIGAVCVGVRGGEADGIRIDKAEATVV